MKHQPQKRGPGRPPKPPATERFTLPEILAAERIALTELRMQLEADLAAIRERLRANDLKLRHLADQAAKGGTK